MAKIDVKLVASYGRGCLGRSCGSEETVQIEVTDNELEVLSKIGANEISRDAVVNAIKDGATVLQNILIRIDEAFYNMVEQYWLFEADNDCLNESLDEALEKDIGEGVYEPISFEEFVERLNSDDLYDEECDRNCDEDIDDIDFEDEEILQYRYQDYIRDKYYGWICKHDHEFIAERVGLNLDACREDEANYTINLNK